MRLSFIKTRDVKSPNYGTKGSAGIDFYVPNDLGNFLISPGESALIPSGIRVELPDDTALIAFNKSGVATKQGLQVGACVIDSDYTGEIHLHVINTTKFVQFAAAGQKLVQFILLPYYHASLFETIDGIFKETDRGDKGFGSTGIL